MPRIRPVYGSISSKNRWPHIVYIVPKYPSLTRHKICLSDTNLEHAARWFKVLSASNADFNHHLLSLSPPAAPQIVSLFERAAIRGRCMQVRTLKTLPIEVIVRGYLVGGAWSEFLYLFNRLSSTANLDSSCVT